MPLNKQKGNMYGFVTHTWNTIKGACPHNCEYCYMKRFGKQSELHFDEKELKTDLGNGNFIFVGSSCDMFSDSIPEEWIGRTLEHCEMSTSNEYLFQTKNPAKLLLLNDFDITDYTTCITLETNRENNLNHAPKRADRVTMFSSISLPKMITIEPIMDFSLGLFLTYLQYSEVSQINIGANTNRKVQLPEPPKEKVLELISELEKFTKVHLKKNLGRLLK